MQVFASHKESSCRKTERVPVDLLGQTMLGQTVVAGATGGKLVKTTGDRAWLAGSFGVLGAWLLAVCLASGMAAAQQGDEKKKDDIPDAPSATRPFPGNLPPPSNPSNPPNSTRPDSGTPPPNQAPPTEANPAAPASSDEPTYAPGWLRRLP